VLKDGIVAFMEEIGDSSHDDVARAFFRYHVGDVGQLLKKVADTVGAAAKLAGGNVQGLLPEANRIVVVRLFP
jgi:nuclear pore complex protein Nup133